MNPIRNVMRLTTCTPPKLDGRGYNGVSPIVFENKRKIILALSYDYRYSPQDIADLMGTTTDRINLIINNYPAKDYYHPALRTSFFSAQAPQR